MRYIDDASHSLRYEKRKHARNIVVPTDDGQVKLDLRSYGEPTCLFGEDAPDRRERLKQLLTKIGPAARKRVASDDSPRPRSVFVNSRTLTGCADPPSRGVGAPHQCLRRGVGAPRQCLEGGSAHPISVLSVR